MTSNSRQLISGWGRYPVAEATLVKPERLGDVAFPDRGTVICRGEGRSYGDAAMSRDGLVMLTSGLSGLCRFDASTGLLEAEAGMTIKAILEHVVPLGWFPPVTPGTKHVSLGGAVAADVHGKNHHRDGAIGAHVVDLELMLADRRTVRCGPDRHADLFWATVGGMGLTGVITKVTLQLIPIESSSIAAQHSKAPNLESAFRWFENGANDDHYTVAWIDCVSSGRSLGRSVMMRGHHARRGELGAYALSSHRTRPYRIPVECPSLLVNPLTVAVFNQAYYSVQGRKTSPFLVDYDRFFYPLDVVGNWNYLYGRRGFLQYQFVIPGAGAFDGVRRVLERVVERHCAIFLAVLKQFGPANPAPLSFPDSGYTLALDLPMRGRDTLGLLDELDDIVLAFGGRVYLAKDARLSSDRFSRMYPRLREWLRVKRAVDPHGRFSSDLARRLGLHAGLAGQPAFDDVTLVEHA